MCIRDRALEEADRYLKPIIEKALAEDWLLIITADHGNDPTTPDTDHNREYVPLLALGGSLRRDVDLGIRESFSDVAAVSYTHLYDLLAKALNYLRDLSRYDQELGGLYERLEPAVYLLDEASREITNYRDDLDTQPGRLEEAENRQYKIRTLCQKYGGTEEEVLKKRQWLAAELAETESFELLEEELSLIHI